MDPVKKKVFTLDRQSIGEFLTHLENHQLNAKAGRNIPHQQVISSADTTKGFFSSDHTILL